jgi:hypothetical protein
MWFRVRIIHATSIENLIVIVIIIDNEQSKYRHRVFPVAILF